MSDIRQIVYIDETRSYRVSADWASTIPFWLTPESTTTITIPANGSVITPLPLRRDGVFRGEYLLARYTGEYLLRMNGSGGYRYNNNDVPVLGWLVASPFAGRPSVLAEAIMVRYGDHLVLELTDRSGAPNGIQFAIAGLLYTPVRFGTGDIRKRLNDELDRYNWLRPHWAAPDGTGAPLVVQPGGQTDFTVTIDQSGFFEVHKIAIWAADLSAISVRMWDFSDQALMQWAMHTALFGGTAEYPFILPVKWGLTPDTRVRGTLYNSSAAPVSVYLALIGRRLLGNVERR